MFERNNKAGRTVSALTGDSFVEGGLNGSRLSLADALDARDLTAIACGGETQAGELWLAIYQHSTGPTITHIAAVLRSGQSKIVAKCVEETAICRHQESLPVAVDHKLDEAFSAHDSRLTRRLHPDLCTGVFQLSGEDKIDAEVEGSLTRFVFLGLDAKGELCSVR